MTQIVDQYIVEFIAKTNKAAADTKKLASANDELARSYTRVPKGQKQFTQAVQNSSYQIADFAVQVGGGVSAMKAFSQQAPQLLAGFGYIGAAAGAVVAILAAGANSLFNFGEAAGNTAKQTNKMAEAVKGLISPSTGLSSLNKELAESESRFASLAVALRDIERNKAVEALAGLENQLGSFITELTRYTDAASTGVLSLSDGLKRLQGDAAAIEGISEKLNVDSDVAEEILKLINAFEQGALDAGKFAEELANLGLDPDTKGFADLLALLNQIALQAAIVKDLSRIDIELNVRGDDLQEAIDAWDDYMAGLDRLASSYLDSLDPLRAYYREVEKLDELLAAELITLEQYRQLIANIRNELLKPIEVKVKPINVKPAETELEGIKAILSEIQTESERWSDQFASQLVDGLKEGKLAFKDFANYVLEQLARIALSKALEPLFNSFGNFIGGITGAVAPVPTGLIAVPANDLPISREMSSVQPMIVGVPRMSAPSSSSSPVTVNVYNQGSNEVEVNERKTTRGIEVDVLIKNAVKKGLASGEFDKVMATSYGARRMAF